MVYMVLTLIPPCPFMLSLINWKGLEKGHKELGGVVGRGEGEGEAGEAGLLR